MISSKERERERKRERDSAEGIAEDRS